MEKYLPKITMFLAVMLIGLTGFTQTRNLDNFDELRVSQGIMVTLHSSRDHRAEIEMIKGDIDDLITEVRNGTLHIKYKKNGLFNWGNNDRKTKIDLYFNTLKSIDVSSGSTVKGDEELSVDKMEIDVSSGATLKLKLQADKSDVDVSSGSTVMLSGGTSELNVEVSSGATFDGRDYQAKNVDVDVSSGASATVWATDRLIADASSGASVRYKGNPKSKNIDASKYSGGSVKEM
jgi:hypothetical protein